MGYSCQAHFHCQRERQREKIKLRSQEIIFNIHSVSLLRYLYLLISLLISMDVCEYKQIVLSI